MLRIYSVKKDKLESGVRVDTLELKGAGKSIPAVKVGEKGRGRQLGVLPVKLLPYFYSRWYAGESVWIDYGEVTVSRSGKPKLVQGQLDDEPGFVIGVFRTPIGFRGDNAHTSVNRKENGYHEEFPGNIIIEGKIAQGMAGRMGNGKQLVAMMPEGVPYRIGIGGRTYGAPKEYFGVFNDDIVYAPMSQEEWDIIKED